MEMKKLFFIFLSLIVSLGTLAQSQIVLNAPQARIIIAKLDSLDYFRDGYAIQDSVLLIANQEIYNRQLAVDARDSIIAKQMNFGADSRDQLRKANAKITFLKYLSCGLAGATIIAIIFGVLK